ncbi:MAG: glycosyltransferase, partial [Planctomycetota bacterium]
MRVLLVSAYFPPQQAVASMRPYTWARTWASSGVDVDVLTTEKREDQRGLDVPAGDYRLHEIA